RDQAETMLSQSKALWNQTDAMVTQARLLAESVKETRKLVLQNERSVEAAESMAATAKAAEAPYFGIVNIHFTDLVVDRYPGLNITFYNGGKTPAWHFYAMPVLVLGDDLDSPNYWHFAPKTLSMAATFIPSDKPQSFEFKQTKFKYTDDIR